MVWKPAQCDTIEHMTMSHQLLDKSGQANGDGHAQKKRQGYEAFDAWHVEEVVAIHVSKVKKVGQGEEKGIGWDGSKMVSMLGKTNAACVRAYCLLFGGSHTRGNNQERCWTITGRVVFS
jgi:hypothetical protein